MIKEFLIITNNDKVVEKLGDKFEIDYKKEYSYKDVLLKCRSLIHEGYKLTTHPLSGSIKPNETPYKSVILEKVKDGENKLDTSSLLIIEDAIMVYDKFQNSRLTPQWIGRIHKDFKDIDLSLVSDAKEKLL